jgi:hydrogenase-4 component B
MSLPELPGGFAAWYATALLLWFVALVLGAVRLRGASPALPVLVTGGSALLLLAATAAGGEGALVLPRPWFLGAAPFAFVVDPLSRWFLAIIGLVGIAAALFSPGYLEHLRHRVALGVFWAALALLMASMSLVVLAGNAIAFLVAWEVMALSSFALVATDHEQHAVRSAALVYLGATRVGTAFLMAGFLWAHQLCGTWEFSRWALSGEAALGPAALIFIGLAAKAGCWPFHLWLPIAHPAAPAPVSAVMSGVMIKTAIYAMVRLLVLGPLAAPALGPVVLVLGAVSAVWGVLFALLQRDLKRLLAYSSVENVGLILMALGLAMVGRRSRLSLLAEVGLAAALFHTLNHALFKGLLFLGAGAVDARTHTRDVERLGGLIHRMPWTAAGFLAGSAAICALPPLNGFASEWLLYQGFVALADGGPSVGTRLAGLLLMAWLALVGALALACFVRAVGVVFLGRPRSRSAERAHEGTRGMLAAQALLAVLCLALGLSAPWVLGSLGQIAAPGQLAVGSGQLAVGSGPSPADREGFVPSLPTPNAQRPTPNARLLQVWNLPLPLLSVALVGTVGALALWMAALARARPARRFITWECGFGDLGPRAQYTATSFAQPIARMFGSVYRYAVDVSVQGRDRRHFPEAVTVEPMYEPYLETRVYTPLLHWIQRTAGTLVMRLQAGSIHQYLLYMALALAVLLWLGYRP